MRADDKTLESKQVTPQGLEISVPTRDEFMRNLAKVAPPPKRDDEPADDEDREN